SPTALGLDPRGGPAAVQRAVLVRIAFEEAPEWGAWGAGIGRSPKARSSRRFRLQGIGTGLEVRVTPRRPETLPRFPRRVVLVRCRWIARRRGHRWRWRPGPKRQERAFTCPAARSCGCSVREEHRQLGCGEDVAGSAAEDHLSEPALS